MKPKTKIQKEVAKLSATLPKLTPAQTEWAYKNGMEHIAYRTKKGNITCPDCGHEWHSDDSTISDTLFGCHCPYCGAELKVEETRKRTYKRISYIGYQVIKYIVWLWLSLRAVRENPAVSIFWRLCSNG